GSGTQVAGSVVPCLQLKTVIAGGLNGAAANWLGRSFCAASVSLVLASRTSRHSLSNRAASAKALRALADSFRSREKRSSTLVGIMKHGNMQLWKRPGTMSGRSSFRFTISCQPAQILEIAPGFGRWTHYLKDYCENLWIVDRSSECIEACRQRFATGSSAPTRSRFT